MNQPKHFVIDLKTRLFLIKLINLKVTYTDILARLVAAMFKPASVFQVNSKSSGLKLWSFSKIIELKLITYGAVI